jgi:RNA polymerase sigma-70 factor, ECF subfamily
MTPICIRTTRGAAAPDRDQASARLADWLLGVARGDRQAFRALYDATCAHLLGVAFELLHHRERAEDALQESYLKVWHAAGLYDPSIARPMTWLINIVRNRAIDMLRAQRSRRDLAVALDDEMAESVVDLAPRPEQQLQRAMAERGIQAALTRLSCRERQAVAQVLYRGLTHAEIAAQARVPLSTAKTWVRRGLANLKAHLDAPASPQAS